MERTYIVTPTVTGGPERKKFKPKKSTTKLKHYLGEKLENIISKSFEMLKYQE